MNVFQVINDQALKRKLTFKNRLYLTGARVKTATIDNDFIPQLPERKNLINISSEEFEEGIKMINDSMAIKDYLFIKMHEKYTISVKNKYKIIFDYIINVLLLVSVISSMYFIAFKDPDLREIVLDHLIWVIFLADFVLSFFSQFKDKNKKVIIMNLTLIFTNYLKGLMIFDIIALIPIRFLGFFKAECVLRLTRTIRISSKIVQFNVSPISSKISELIYPNSPKKKTKLNLKIYTVWSIILEVFKMFWASFTLACLWYSFANYINKRNLASDNFITKFDMQDLTVIEKFIRTWYFIFTTLATVGYGDFVAINKYEQIFSIVLLISGPAWFAYSMGKAISIINSLQDIKGVKSSRTSLQKWFSMIETSNRGIPLEVKESITRHYMYFWKNDRLGDLMNNSQEDDFNANNSSDEYFNSLPFDIQNMLLDYIFKDIFYSFHSFFTVFDTAKFELSRFLQPRIYIKNDIIINYDNFVEELLFSTQGTVQLSIHKNYLSGTRKHLCFKDCKVEIHRICNRVIVGDYFAIKKIRSSYEFSALTNVKGFAIPVFALNEIVKFNYVDLSCYLSSIQGHYIKLKDTVLDKLSQRHQDTHNADQDEEESYIRKMEYESANNDIKSDFSVYLSGTSDSDLIQKEIISVEEVAINCNVRRREIMSLLKDKISTRVLPVFKNRRKKELL